MIKILNKLKNQNKGYAIGNQPKLAEAHNSYAKYSIFNFFIYKLKFKTI